MCGHLQLNILAYAKADPQGHASKMVPIFAIMVQWTLRGLSNVETPTSLGHVGRHWDLQGERNLNASKHSSHAS
ncbi:hypothetical protein D3C85_1545540 [compost metagenome]